MTSSQKTKDVQDVQDAQALRRLEPYNASPGDRERSNNWDKPFLESQDRCQDRCQDSQSEVLLWKEYFDCCGYPFWSPSPKVDVLTYSDASGEGWGGFAGQFSEKVARGCWSSADCMKSSTFREVKAISRLVLESYSEEVRGKEVLHWSDNRNVQVVLSVGSRKEELHQEAVGSLQTM